jgi:soluble lytic murein transglycosylase-like protein
MAHPAHVTSAATWRPLVRWYWPASQVEYALVIMRRESGGRPGALNAGSGCAGLFQLAPCWYAGRFNPFDPEQNVKHAVRVWRSSGWHAWVTAW